MHVIDARRDAGGAEKALRRLPAGRVEQVLERLSREPARVQAE